MAAMVAVLGCGDDTTGAGAGDGSGSGASMPSTSTADASTAGEPAGTSSGSAAGESSSGGHEPPPIFDLGAPDDPAPGCVPTASDYIHLLASDTDGTGRIHRFDPETLEVELVGDVDCAEAQHPAALTVDRDGRYWELALTATGVGIFVIDPVELVCTKTAFVDPQDDGQWGVRGGLAFVSDEPGGSTESLYLGLTAIPGEGVAWQDIPMTLGRVDTSTYELSIVGSATVLPTQTIQIADLTGTGDAKLFGVFVGEPAFLVDFDLGTGGFTDSIELPFVVESPWALAQWGGRLWTFSAGPDGSRVRAFDPVSQEIEDLHPGIGVNAVGAAVSTCAPYGPAG